MIPVQNIYYLLCYAWNRLKEGEIVSVSQLEKNEVSLLFAKVLSEGTSHILRKGLDRGYIPHFEETQKLRGRINFEQTLKKTFFKQPKIYCDFDELSHNILCNKILKSTIKTMMHCDGLTDEVNNNLKNIYFRLHDVSEISLTKNVFRQIRLNKNNYFYDFLLKVCELVYDNLLPSKENSSKKFRDFFQDETIMRCIFEEFIRNFYKKHLSGYKVGRTDINWNFEAFDVDAQKVLPKMQTDITIESENRKIIIDAKYYKDALHLSYNKEKLNSANLYQLFSYLINQEDPNNNNSTNCDGILLYPTVGSDYNYQYQYKNHKISIKTINLNQDWKQIERDLISLIN